MGKHSYEINYNQFKETTSGPTQNYTMNYGVYAQQGWQCPICKRVLSPWTPECPCQGQGMRTFTTVSVDKNTSKTYTLHNTDDDIWKHIPTINTYFNEKE